MVDAKFHFHNPLLISSFAIDMVPQDGHRNKEEEGLLDVEV